MNTPALRLSERTRRIGASALDTAVRPDAHLARAIAAAGQRTAQTKDIAMHKLAIATAAIAALVATSANAEPQRTTVHATLRYAAEEAASPAGAERLLQRITLQATSLCAPKGLPSLQPGLSRSTRDCRHEAVARTVRALDAPVVTAEFEKTYGRSTIVSAAR